jgi:hypothetical protein
VSGTGDRYAATPRSSANRPDCPGAAAAGLSPLADDQDEHRAWPVAAVGLAARGEQVYGSTRLCWSALECRQKVVVMPVENMAWNWHCALGGDNGSTASIQVNFAPTKAVAQTSLTQGTGGLGLIGISQYVTRSQPDGADEYHNIPLDFSDGAVTYGYRPLVYDPLMTGVTATFLVGGGNDQITGTLMVSLWS